MIVVGDIGSTFVKLAGMSAEGDVLARASAPTARTDLAAAVERARGALLAQVADRSSADELILSSSAGGGLRVVVLGFERDLTVRAATRAGATAGARIVGVYTDAELAEEDAVGFASMQADIALLTGGTDGGDERSIIRSAELLAQLAPALPVVVAGNTEAAAGVRHKLGNGRPVEFVANVMPRVGELDGGPAQNAIRRIFIEHVIGRGRLASASAVAAAVRMPTPAAVLAGTEIAASLRSSDGALSAPVVVDVGGATTDVHSLIADEGQTPGYSGSPVPDQRLTRTVEGDLGLRESAATLVAAALDEGLAETGEAAALETAASRRERERDYLPGDQAELRLDERLAQIATTIALLRHAGVMRTSLTAAGAVLRRTGRDLREASCLIVTGGAFAHSPRSGEVAAAALRDAHRLGALIAPALPIFTDRSYLLWAAGLLRGEHPLTAAALVRSSLEPAAAS